MRKRISIPYFVSYESATSIPLYLQNLIKAFKLLEENKKPEIILVYKDDTPIDDLKKIEYPYIKYIKEYNNRVFLQKIFQKIFSVFFRKTVWIRNYWHPFYPKVDIAFIHQYFDRDETKVIHWVVDMQQYVYPEFFPKNELKDYANYLNKLVRDGSTIMFSSRDSFDTFKKHFPKNSNPYTVMPFASLVEFESEEEMVIRNKYNLKSSYFITPNQFWPHKNHITILKAALKLSHSNTNFHIVFTGKMSSYRNTNIASELMSFVEENNLQKHISFLGFVPRDDLFNLLNYSTAIIQPSLFEGWSTLIEECKALNKYVILTDIPIHREQISLNCKFFNPMDHEELSKAIETTIENNSLKVQPTDYQNNIQQFLKDICITFKL